MRFGRFIGDVTALFGQVYSFLSGILDLRNLLFEVVKMANFLDLKVPEIKTLLKLYSEENYLEGYSLAKSWYTLNSTSLDAAYIAALFCEKTSRQEEEEKYLQACLKIQPGFCLASNNLAVNCIRDGKFQEALRILALVDNELSTTIPSLLFNTGLAFCCLERFEEAIETWKSLPLSYKNVANLLFRIYWRLERVEDALSINEEYLDEELKKLRKILVLVVREEQSQK